MARPGVAHIDLGALRHNYRLARSLHGGRMLAVLKANAYGHGAVRCAQALQELADGFAVAFLEEALPLRAAGIRAPILVLEGLFDADELPAVQAHGLWFAVHQESQLRMLEQVGRAHGLQGPRGLHAWLKIDSGMGRAGFAPRQAASAHARLSACAAVDRITLMTHFARADEPGHGMTREQIHRFDEATAGLPGERSLCNSAGLMAWPEARRDWGRAGIALYGADPLPRPPAPTPTPTPSAGLLPVMGLHSQVFAVRTLQPGEPLGYGARHVAQRPTRVGLVAMGYADGYPRTAPEGTPVAVDGQAARLIGRVSMDMLTVDLTDLPQAGIGSAVQLWGPLIDVNTVARAAGTIAYELLCNVKRVPLLYTAGDEGASAALALDCANITGMGNITGMAA